jgi:integrase
MTKHYGKTITHKGAIIRERDVGYQVEINWMKRRIRHTEVTLEDAKTWAEAEISRLKNEGMAVLAFTESQRHDAISALFLLLPYGTSLSAAIEEYVAARKALAPAPLTEAVGFWTRHHKPAGGVKTVKELLEAYVAAKKEKGKRERSIRDIQSRMNIFARTFGDRPVQTITTADIEGWLKECGYQGQTQINYLTVLTGFFNYAIKQRLIELNPAKSEAIDRPDRDQKMAEVFAVADVEKIMAAAAKLAPRIVPMLALGFWAGLRTSEIEAIDWNCINFESRRIKVIPAVAKKRRQRFVTMQDNLIEWLLPYRVAAGPVAVPFITYRRGIDKIITATDVKWVHNGMRHTMASCHLAKFQDMNTLVIEMGHADKADVLFGHYLDLVTPEDADRYWKIRPAKQEAAVDPAMAQAV